MQEFISFLNEYKEIIVSVLCCVLSFICLLVKRRPKTLDEFLVCIEELNGVLPELINKVEVPGHGISKKCRVEDMACKIIENRLSRKLTDKERELVLSCVSKNVEAILSTPQKKGV